MKFTLGPANILEMEKGRGLPIGTVRDWKGHKYRKESGGWKKLAAEKRAPVASESEAGENKPLKAEIDKLPEEKKQVILSKGFKDWFGDWVNDPGHASKVVDHNLIPQEQVPTAVYHGTAHGGFTEFDKTKQDPESLYGSGFYFTEDPEVAQTYQQKGRELTWGLRMTLGETKAFVLKMVREYNRAMGAPAAISDIRLKSVEAWSTEEEAIDTLRRIISSPTTYGLNDSLFIEKPAKEAQVFEVYLNIKKPFDIDNDVITGDILPKPVLDALGKMNFGESLKYNQKMLVGYEKHLQVLMDMPKPEDREELRKHELNIQHGKQSIEYYKQEVARLSKDFADPKGMKFSYKALGLPPNEINDILRKAGYDGLTHEGGHVRGGKKHRVWIAFEPTQIKAAKGNVGTFDPKVPDIMKSTELPVGTRKKYGDYWYKKDGSGKWLYDGVDTKKAGAPAPTKTQDEQANRALGDKAAGDYLDGLLKFVQRVNAGDADRLKAETTRRDRLAEGQEVSYQGNFHKQYRGQTGKVIAIGNKGAAMVKMPDGKIVDCRWGSLKPQGVIQEHTPYEGLTDDNLYSMQGPLADAVGKVMDTTIGRSGLTYRNLCEKFHDQGFTLYIVGGTVRDFLQGKDTQDIDFIVDCSDAELQGILKTVHPAWANTWAANERLGLVTIHDGNEVIDITPFHKHAPELPEWQLKGWKLKGDAESRDFALNSLQLNPLTGVVIDGTGRGMKGVLDKTLDFCSVEMLKSSPRYTLRAFKFMSRGYKPTPETEKAIRDNLQYTQYMRPEQKKRFIHNQVVEKDGVEGLKKFKSYFLKYDAGGAIWNNHFEMVYRALMREAGGK